MTPDGLPSTLGVATGTAAERAWSQVEDKLRVTLIGEYELRGLIGRGGMAAVYLADELALDRKVAVKVMSPALVYGDGMVDRFRREAKTIAGLSHPHIIPLYRVVEKDELFAIVMKFVNGRPLDSIIAETGPMPIPMVQSILAQVSGALAYAHRKGIIHRDIKPANIMIDDDGSAIVCDFGIAKAAGIETPLTMTGATVGTPRYMSPEQWTGEGLSGAADQYSLGVVAFEMLTGQPPFVGSSVMDVMAQHFNQPTPKVETLRRDVSPALAQVVNRMLAKAPADRFAKLDDVARQLDKPEIVHDDAVRSQLMTLAASGDRHRRMEAMLKAAVPVSPVPASRPSSAMRADAPTVIPSLQTAGSSGSGRMAKVAAISVTVLGLAASGVWMTTRGEGVPAGDSASVQRPVGPQEPSPDSGANAGTGAASPEQPPRSTDGPDATVERSGPIGAEKPKLPPAKGPATKGSKEAKPSEKGTTVALKPDSSKDKTKLPGSDASQDTATVEEELPPTPPIEKPIVLAAPIIRVGTREPNAVVYINDRPQPLSTSIRSFTMPGPGAFRVAVKMTGCVAWDTTVSLGYGGVAAINFRQPKCP